MRSSVGVVMRSGTSLSQGFTLLSLQLRNLNRPEELRTSSTFSFATAYFFGFQAQVPSEIVPGFYVRTAGAE